MANYQFATTVLKAFDDLDCFETGTEELGISDIAAQVGLPASSVYRLIQSLEFEGLLFQNQENKKYYLGSKFYTLAGKGGRFQKFQQLASKYVDELADLTQETVNLAICSGDRIFNIYKKDSPYIVRPNFALNAPYPAHCTGTGRIFLSQMTDTALKWVYENSTADIPQPLPDFLDMLHKVRQNGWAQDDQEFTPGLRCVAAPVRAAGETVVFALSISAPTIRMTDEVYEQSRQLVLKYAALITEKLQAFCLTQSHE